MREYTSDMCEISGFGGGYEETCRKMVLAGLDWLEAHPNADPKFRSYENVTGLCMEDNDDAKALSDVVIAASDNEATGAMHHACINHILFIKAKGWKAYVEAMKETAD